MKHLIILLLIISCGSPVERIEDEPIKGTKPIVKVEVKDEPKQPVEVEPENNDWRLVKSVQGHWDIIGEDGTKDHDEYCVYEFYYSRSRGEFKLELEGYRPKNHSTYKYISKLLVWIYIKQLEGVKDIDIINALQHKTNE